MTPFTFRRNARTRRAALTLLAIWSGIVAMWVLLDAADVLTALLLLATLPAALDFARGHVAELVLDASRIAWHSGRRSGEVALARLACVRLERRLDLTMRVRLVTDTGKRIPLPQDCVPDPAALEAALRDRGVAVERHPFSLV